MQAYSKDGSPYKLFAEFSADLKQLGTYNISFHTIMYCNAEDGNCEATQDQIVVALYNNDNPEKNSKKQPRNELLAEININSFEQNKWAETWTILEIDEVYEEKIEVNYLFSS